MLLGNAELVGLAGVQTRGMKKALSLLYGAKWARDWILKVLGPWLSLVVGAGGGVCTNSLGDYVHTLNNQGDIDKRDWVSQTSNQA